MKRKKRVAIRRPLFGMPFPYSSGLRLVPSVANKYKNMDDEFVFRRPNIIGSMKMRECFRKFIDTLDRLDLLEVKNG